jgi:ABC-type antimicrobial peptide transport system permease subunit
MQGNPIQNNPMAFFVGVVIFFIGLLATVFYLFVRTAHESLIMPGPTLRPKHIILALVIAFAGAVIASFARPRSSGMSDAPRYNR